VLRNGRLRGKKGAAEEKCGSETLVGEVQGRRDLSQHSNWGGGVRGQRQRVGCPQSSYDESPSKGETEAFGFRLKLGKEGQRKSKDRQ